MSLFHLTLPAEEQATLDAEHDEAITAIRQYESDTKTQPQTAGRPSGSRGCYEPEGIDLTLYKRIGEERTRTPEFEPGKLYVREIVRPRYGLKDNITPAPEGTSSVVIAPLPSSPIYKGLAGATMLAEILLQKYEYHVPFYRQVKEFRHLGIRISESTLSGWFKPVCGLFRPLYEELKRQVVRTDYIQVDETTVDVINKEKRQTDKEYLWMTRAVRERLVFTH